VTKPALLHLLSEAFDQRARALRGAGVLRETELLVIDAIAPRFGESRPDVLLGLAFALRAPRVGDVGVHLPTIRGRVDDKRSPRVEDEEPELPLDWPEEPAAWESAVFTSPMLGSPGQTERPFVRQILKDGRSLIMTRRMWREQERLAAAALAMAAGQGPSLGLSEEAIAGGLMRLFGGAESQGARAVAAAARGRLSIVTGGPGTGKTYSIKRLLALLVESADQARPLRIELAAPTGKAAVRMAEAIGEDLQELEVDERVRNLLSGLAPKTLHKLLGLRPDGSCRHGPERPILADLVVVDEASMVDLTLMRRLFEAIPAGARLVLLGDRDQLASVEAGTVLADFVAPVLDGESAAGNALADAVVPFDKNHRFREAPTVAAVAAALQRRGDEQLDQVGRWMSGAEVKDDDPLPDRIRHLGAPAAGGPSEAQLAALAEPYLAADGYVGELAAALRAWGPQGAALQDPSVHRRLLDAFGRYRILAVHRRGRLGVSGLEQAMLRRCQGALKGAIRQRAGLGPEAPVKLPARGSHWLGRPLMITQNSYELELRNGDIGLVLPSPKGLVAVFPVKRDGQAATRELDLARLPEHSGAFAMTVHKSQGSQFRRIAVVLAGRDSPIQTRELVYTAITRTSSRLDWLGDLEELDRALRRRVGRASGLGELLWG